MKKHFAANLKNLTFLIFFLITTAHSQKILSWNLCNFGTSKSAAEIDFIAVIVKYFDIIAVQEVVGGPGGPKAVARLADALNRTGSNWDYAVSSPTSGTRNKTERYAYLWRTSVVKMIGKAWLENQFAEEIDREPYLATFSCGMNHFTLANFHAITKNRQPETEIRYFKLMPDEYPLLNLVFLGDFNCPQSHTVFNPLRKMGWKPVFTKQKTSLKKECKSGNCLASEFDNIWYDGKKMTVVKSGVIAFFQSFETLKVARRISDHIPVTVQF